MFLANRTKYKLDSFRFAELLLRNKRDEVSRGEVNNTVARKFSEWVLKLA